MKNQQNENFLPRSSRTASSIKIWLLVLGGVWLASCNVHRDVTRNPIRWSRLDRDYVLCEPVFLVRWRDSGEYSLEIPGKSGVPCSLEEYYACPNTWMHKEPFLRGEQRIAYTPVIAVIPAGTLLRLFKITQARGWDNDLVVSVWAKVGDPQYSKLKVATNSLLDGCVDLDPRPVPKPEYLLPADYHD
jgi:hypothetical protein